MKNILLLITSLVLIIFATITWFKTRSSSPELQADSEAMTLADKTRTQRFWELYRQAREQRLAGRLNEALESYESALKLNPEHENALYYFGNVSLALGKFKQAEKAWKRLVQINPTSARAHYQLGDLYLNFEEEEFFDTQKAKAEYLLALEINKEETRPFLRLGHVALIHGKMQEAGDYFDAVIGSHYKSVEAYFLKGYIAWKRGNSEEALAMLTSARKYSEPLKPVHGVLGEGDTKPGESSRKLESKTGSIFYSHLADIAELDESNMSQEIMEVWYQDLDEFLVQIRKLLNGV